jgi:hypothetical protein
MAESISSPRHLRLVSSQGASFVPLGHQDRAALMIVQLLNVWMDALSGELSADEASKVGFNLVSDHLTAVEAETLNHISTIPVQ